MSGCWKTWLGLLFAALLQGLGPDANAASLSIDVGYVGGETHHLTPDLTERSPGVFTSSGQLTETDAFTLGWDLQLEGDPAIMGSFTLTNLSSTTQIFSVSATLGVLPLGGPTLMGGSFGDLGYSDLGGDGAVGLATVGASPFYQALIDGASVQDLGSFDLGPAPGILPKLAFGAPIPSAPGPGVGASIGVAFPAFSLTGGDQLQTPFEFVVVVPEPASGLLLGMGLAALASLPPGRGSRTR